MVSGSRHAPGRGRATAAAVVWTLGLALVACTPSDDGGPAATPPASTSTAATPARAPASAAPPPAATTTGLPPAPRTLATRLRAPWGLDFLPGGEALVTERDTGRLLRVSPGGDLTELGTVPGVVAQGESGLLGVAVDPDDPDDVYVYATTEGDNRVLRLRLDGDRFAVVGPVLTGIPRAANHDGGRLSFGPDGYLYVTTGDAGDPSSAQDLDSLGGKILRITTDGEPAPGNPVPGSPVWTLGHRNVQGIGWTDDGRMLASEFGQNTYDELNLVRPGENYGWPRVEGRGGKPEFADPLQVWRPAEASPSGIAVVGDVVYLAGLRGESLWRVPDAGTGRPERLLRGVFGRLRAVAIDDEGRMWLLTSNRSRGEPAADDDRVIVLDPATLETD